MKARGLFLLALCVALTGCGGSSNASGPPVRGTPEGNHQCNGSKLAVEQQRQRRKLTADLRRLRAAAVTVNGYTQKGNPAINRAVDRFELDVAEEAIPVTERSRFIDRAAAIVSGHCYLCFQALEANRPLAAGAKLACG